VGIEAKREARRDTEVFRDIADDECNDEQNQNVEPAIADGTTSAVVRIYQPSFAIGLSGWKMPRVVQASHITIAAIERILHIRVAPTVIGTSL
jgi:hypothetical protein